MTNQTAICPECGAQLPPDAPQGLCASCLLREGFSAMVDASPVPGAAVRPPATHCFADYELQREIARGGMGIVYLAKQVSLSRAVALKMISAGQLATQAEVQRFHTEAQAAARLDHPNIVPIYDIAEKDGCHYFTMKLVEGGSLAERLSNSSSSYSPREAAQLIAKLARAVHYAHQRGILHRDLKPTNILLDPHGTPYLTDFGLAKILENQTNLTQSLAVMGTANYMSPEQASGRAHEVTTATDIYSLGAILFELLTGQPPFQSDTLVATLRKVVEEDPRPPKALNPSIDRDLNTITLKCLEKQPVARYSSAEALAEDLERWLGHEPILARPASTCERIVKAARRRPAVAGLSSAIGLALLLGFAGVLWQWHRAEENALQSRSRLVHSYLANGVKRMDDGDLFGSLPWLLESWRMEQDNPERASLQRLRLESILRQCPRLVQVWFHESPLNDAVISPDGRLAATGTSAGTVRIWRIDSGQLTCPPIAVGRQIHSVLFSPDNTKLLTLTGEPGVGGWELGIAHLWDVATGKALGQFGPEGHSVDAAAFSPDNSKLALGSFRLDSPVEGSIQIYDTSTCQPVARPMQHRGRVASVEFSRDGSRLLTASFDGVALVWNTKTNQREGAPLRHRHSLIQASFNPDASRVITAGRNGVAEVWETATSQPLGPPLNHGRIIYGAGFSADNQTALTMGYDATARLWNPETGVQICPPLKHDILVWRARFSPDASRVATASFDTTARVWDAAKGEAATPPLNHAGFVQAVSFSPDGYYLLTASRDGTARLWAWDRKNGDALPLSLGAPVLQSTFSPDGKQVLTASEGQSADIWDATTGNREMTFQHKKKVNAAVFSPGGQRIATASSDGTARVWDAATGDPITPPLLHSNSVRSVAFSPDGTRLLTASSDFSAQIWDARTGATLGKPMLHTNALRYACFSPNGQKIATASEDLTARVWDASTGEPLTPPLSHPSVVQKVAFSPDNTRIVSCCYDRSFNALAAYVWDIASARQVTPPLQHKDGVSWAAFSPDGGRIVTAGEDQCARVWDARTGQPLTPSLIHKHHVTTAVFSPDGRKIATASFDKTARVWDAQTGEPLTPFLPHEEVVNHVAFSPDSLRIVTSSSDGHARVWLLSTNSSSLAQTTLLTELLSGKRVDANGRLLEVDTASLSNAWQTLRAGNPGIFQVTPAEILSWHRNEASRAERLGHFFAARFHLQKLAESGDLAAQDRLKEFQ